MSKQPYRAATNEGESVMFWGDAEREDTDDLAPVTVLRVEPYATVIYNGRKGLMRAGEVTRLDTTANPAVPSRLKESTKAAEERVRDLDGFPAFPLPIAESKRKPPPHFHVLEEAVAAGFTVPNGVIRSTLSHHLLAALQRPNGVAVATEIINWASEKPHLAPQIPALLPDMPREVIAAFVRKAPIFLARAGKQPEPYISLFRVALGLPPSAMISATGVSAFQPYGAVARQATFHPSPVFLDDILKCRLMLEADSIEDAMSSLRITQDTADSGALNSPSGENRLLLKRMGSMRNVESGKVSNRKDLVFVESTERNIVSLCRCLRSLIPLLIEGDTGTGKTVSVTAAAERMEMDAIRFNLSSGTTVQDLVGRMQISGNRLELSLQPFTRAFSEGLLLVLDECNLAQEEVLATLETALDTGLLIVPDPSNPARAAKEIRRHPGFRLIITQNPCTGLFAGKRHRLSPAFLSRFLPVVLEPLTQAELSQIAATKLASIMGGAQADWLQLASLAAEVHTSTVSYVADNRSTAGVETSLTVFSCRDLLNMVKLLTHTIAPDSGGAGDTPDPRSAESTAKGQAEIRTRFPASAWCTYGVRFLGREQKSDVWSAISRICEAGGVACTEDAMDAVNACLDMAAQAKGGQPTSPTPTPSASASASPAPSKAARLLRQPLPTVGSAVWCADDDNVAAPRHPLVVTERVLDSWRMLDFVMELGRPVLLVGKGGTGTSHMALGYAAVRTDRHYLCHVTTETITGSLIGQNVPSFQGDEVTKWVNGPVTEAMQHGKWLVLDDLPSASPTVLERLNSVLEEDPELFIAERGSEKQVKVNPSFRILATAEHSQLALLSPAFANRFTVIVLAKPGPQSAIQEEMNLFCRSMLFSHADALFDRRGPHLKVVGNTLHSQSTGYTGAMASLELQDDHEWDVTLSGSANGILVGVALELPSLSFRESLFESPLIWGYSNHGFLVHSEAAAEEAAGPQRGAGGRRSTGSKRGSLTPKVPEEGGKRASQAEGKSPSKKPIGVKVGAFGPGDTIRVSVSLSDPSKQQVTFYKNGEKQGSLQIARSPKAGGVTHRLKPFVGLHDKGSSATLSIPSPEPTDDQINQSTKMCVDSLSKGSYGMYSVVRAIKSARKLAGDCPVDVTHLRKALLVTEVGTGWIQLKDARSNSLLDAGLGKRASRGAPSLRAAVLATMSTNEVSPSLSQVTQRVSWCVSLGIPVLLIDDHHWDLKSSLFKETEQVTATSQSSLSEWLGSILPTCTKDKISITRVSGPLMRALDAGKCFLIEGIANLSSAVQCQLGPLLDTGVLSRPGEGPPIRCSTGFSAAGICSSRELERLHERFSAKFVRVYLPPPKCEDYTALMPFPNATIPKVAERLTHDIDMQMDMRIFKRAQARVKNLTVTGAAAPSPSPSPAAASASQTRRKSQGKGAAPPAQPPAGKAGGTPELLWGLCYAVSLLQACKSDDDVEVRSTMLKEKLSVHGLFGEEEAGVFMEKLSDDPTISDDAAGNVSFSAWGLTAKMKGKRGNHPQGGTSVMAVRRAVVSVAFAAASSENILLAGPTSCKTLAAMIFCDIVSKVPDVLHMTCSTDVGGLLGSIHPYSPEEYRKTVETETKMLDSRKGEDVEAWQRMLKSMEEVRNTIGSGDGAGVTVFAFKDGPLTQAVKLGRGVVIKSANLPDHQLYTTLEDLLHRHVLPLAVASPTGAAIPLKEGVPLILTVTCPAESSLPPALDALCVTRCRPYSVSDVHGIIEEAIAGNGKKDDETKLLARSIVSQLDNVPLKAQLRLAAFISKYSVIAGIKPTEALVLGMHLLMHRQVDRNSLAQEGWDAELIERCCAQIPEKTALQDDKLMRDFVQIDTASKTVRLTDLSGKVLGVAPCVLKDQQERIDASPMVPTPSLLQNLSSIFAASTLRMPLLLEGAPGIGKSFLVESAATMLGAEFVRVQFSAGTAIAHLFGAPMPTIEGGVRVFKRQEGVLGEALNKASEENEVWVLLDELNLAPPEVQQALSPMIQQGVDRLVLSATESYPMRHVRVFAAVNPATIGGGRSHLPPSVKDLFAILNLADLGCSEALWIARSKFQSKIDLSANQKLQAALLKELAYIHGQVLTDVQEGRLGREVGESSTSVVNLRTLEKVVLLLSARLGKDAPDAMRLSAATPTDAIRIKSFFLQVVEVIYLWRFPSAADRARVSSYMQSMAKRMGTFVNTHPSIEAQGFGDLVVFGQACMLRGGHPSHSPALPPSEAMRHRLCALACAAGSSLGVLLEGATASGKTSLVRELARICGQKLRVIPITPNTEISELLGMWVPWKGLAGGGSNLSTAFAQEAARLGAAFVSSSEAASKLEKLAEVRTALCNHLDLLLVEGGGGSAASPAKIEDTTLALCKALKGTAGAKKAARLGQLYDKVEADVMSFHFAESQLIHAIHDGDWVLLDNIDWAPPAAIERLNSLLEADASFKLVERGDEEDTVKKGSGIHENFKMFFTANPSRKHAAKLSSAFLNRVVRLVLNPFGQPVVGSNDTSLPNAIFCVLTPDAPGVRFWQYLCTRFHLKAHARQPSSISIRVLHHCIGKWRDDILSHSHTHTSLFLLCHNLLATYTRVCPLEAQGLLEDLASSLAEAHILAEKSKKTKRKSSKKHIAEKQPDDAGMSESSFFQEDEFDIPQREESGMKEDLMPVDDIAQRDVVSEGSDDGGDIADDVQYEVKIPEAVTNLQETCLTTLRSATLQEKGEEAVVTCDGQGLRKLATELCHMWSEKSGGVVEELLANLVSAPTVNTSECIYSLACKLGEKFGDKYKDLTEVHLLVMKLYTMEGPDIDRLLGFQGVPIWKVGKQYAAEQALWREYRDKYRGKRNEAIYISINNSLRNALDGDPSTQIEAKMTLRHWIKTVGLQMTMCDLLPKVQVYRSLSRLPEFVIKKFASYKVGETIGWPSPSSTSKRRCDDFLGKDSTGNCRFSIKDVTRGLEMEHISEYVDEEEIVLPPFSLLEITRTETTGHGLEIDAKIASMVCWDDPALSIHLKRFIADARNAMNTLRYKITKRGTQSLMPLLSQQEYLTEISSSAENAFSKRASAAFNGGTVAATAESLQEDVQESERLPPVSLSEAEAECEAFRARRAVVAAARGLSAEVRSALRPDPAAIDSAAEALRSLLPCNTFTRFEAAASGVELYIPGLIKAITTNFTYNKVFASKSAGGARSYACAVALDVSTLTSTIEGIPRGHLELLATLRAALSLCEIEPCVLLCSPLGTYCVHSSGNWDDISTFTLLRHATALMDRLDPSATSHGESLRMACSVAKELRGKRKQLFYITASEVCFDSGDVSETLKTAETAGVDVLGIGLLPCIHDALPKAVSLPSPDQLGKGLARYLQGPYAPPAAATSGKGRVEEDQVFWGRHPASVILDGYTAKATGKAGASANLLSLEVVREGVKEWCVLVTSDTPVFIGIGSAALSQEEDLSSAPQGSATVWHSQTGKVQNAPDSAVGVKFPSSSMKSTFFSVTINMDGRSVKVSNDKGVAYHSGTFSLHEPQLLVGFTGPGEVGVTTKADASEADQPAQADDTAKEAEEAPATSRDVWTVLGGVIDAGKMLSKPGDTPFSAVYSTAIKAWETYAVKFHPYTGTPLEICLRNAGEVLGTSKVGVVPHEGCSLYIQAEPGDGPEDVAVTLVLPGEGSGFSSSVSSGSKPMLSLVARDTKEVEVGFPDVKRVNVFASPASVPVVLHAVNKRNRFTQASALQLPRQWKVSVQGPTAIFKFVSPGVGDHQAPGYSITPTNLTFGTKSLILQKGEQVLMQYNPRASKATASTRDGEIVIPDISKSTPMLEVLRRSVDMQEMETLTIESMPFQAERENREGSGWIRVGKYITALSSKRIQNGKNKYSSAMRAGISSGKHSWNIILTNGINGSVVGVGTKAAPLDGTLYRKPTTWIFSNHGKASHGPNNTFEGKTFNGTRHVITVHLDMESERRTVEFEVDGTPVNGALIVEEDVDEVFPLVGLYVNGSQAEFAPHEAPEKEPGVQFEVETYGMAASDPEKPLRLSPNTDGRYCRLEGPAIDPSGTFSWDVRFNGSLNGCTAGVMLQGMDPPLADDGHLYHNQSTWVLTNHGTMHAAKAIKHLEPLVDPGTTVRVTLNQGKLSFAIKKPTGGLRQTSIKQIDLPEGALVRPVVGAYEEKTVVVITPIHGFEGGEEAEASKK